MTEKLPNKDVFSLLYITALTVAALLYGFSTIPSPTEQRDSKLDHQRVSDLGQLNYSIDAYYTTNQQLPQSLDVITNNSYSTGTPLIKNDPVTKKPYVYIVVNATSYKLCATFATDSNKEEQYTYDDTNYSYAAFSDAFRHDKGYTCFLKLVPARTTPPIGPADNAGSKMEKPVPVQIRNLPAGRQVAPAKQASPPAK